LASTSVYYDRVFKYQDTLIDIMDAKIANNILAYDSLLLFDIIRRPGDILHKALAASSNQLQLATIFLTPNFSRNILIKKPNFSKKYTDKGPSTIRPGFSAWWFSVAIGTWNSCGRHLECGGGGRTWR